MSYNLAPFMNYVSKMDKIIGYHLKCNTYLKHPLTLIIYHNNCVYTHSTLQFIASK